MMKKFRKKLNNRGSSFVMVIVTMAFLSVLATSILVAAAFSYRLKVYNLNSRNNFYYVEQALDEIYAGVGTIAVTHLKEAYYDTLEVLTYYDLGAKEYVTMQDADANKLMKRAFLQYLKQDNSLKLENIADTLSAYITDSDNEADFSNINVVYTDDGLVIQNLTIKRTAKYDLGSNGDDYIQSITTDIVIGEPAYNVRFGNANAYSNSLYEYSLIADMGIEMLGATSQINVSGNLYGAADFYNKDYDSTDEKNRKTTNSFEGKTSDVSSYQKDDTRYLACNGLLEESMYSGLYISGAHVILQSDYVVVPGTFGVFNGGQLVLSTSSDNNGDGRIDPCEMWVDNLVLGGYSPIAGASKADLFANAYIYDDIELNADNSRLKLEGAYYGYNYSQSADERHFLTPAKGNYQNSKGENTNDHYNSSSIILNGQQTELDFSKLDKMYIAGRSYVELSKTTQKSEKEIGDDETVETRSYMYDKNIKDYITGESISIKSNQLAYMALRSWITDKNGEVYATIPNNLKAEETVNGVKVDHEPYDGFYNQLRQIPVIKQEISGNTYYFFDLDKYAAPGFDKAAFIQAYANFFEIDAQTDEYKYIGAKYLKDITDYQKFSVSLISLPESDMATERYMYSNGALTSVDGAAFSIKAPESAQEVFSKLLHVFDTGDKYEGATAYMSASTELQSEYNMVKYLLTISKPDVETVKNKVKKDENGETKDYTPLEYYINMEKVSAVADQSSADEFKQGISLPNGYKIWISDGDIELKPGDDSMGTALQGIVIAKGDVTFGRDDSGRKVDSFTGLIISGSKIRVGYSVNFFADPSVVKEVLRQCDSLAAGGNSSMELAVACFKDYGEIKTGTSEAIGGEEEEDPDATEEYLTGQTDSLDKDITEVRYIDVVAYKNWKKNVE
ncbi:MAG: hypothetical protein K2G89_03485 [Lachnospiraceae bacterium]|nr:hypothetical protein [Lachnospiraceae bacterium]